MTSVVQVMIVEDNQELAESIRIYFSIKDALKVAAIASNSLEAIEILRTTKLDVIILDIVMPHADGFVLLEYLSKLQFELRPEVIILSALSNDALIKRACNLGAMYYMVKPFSVDVLHERIINIVEFMKETKSSFADSFHDVKLVDKCIYDHLREMGISKNINGYSYIFESVKLVIERPELAKSMTKLLYPAIGEMYHTTPESVERSIRYAIKDAWNNEKLHLISAPTDKHDYIRSRPSNSKFISLLSSSVLRSIS